MRTTTNNTTSMTIRLDKNVKKDAAKVYKDLGLDMTAAINVFLRKSIQYKGFPFEVTMQKPNAITMAAIERAQNEENLHGPYKTVDELFEALDA